MDDPVLAVLSRLVPGGVRPGELRRDDRVLRWAESGSGRPAVVLDAALGEPGTLAWAGVMPLLAPRTRVLAYDRAGLGASDPVSPLSLQAQVDDLVAVVRETGERCVLAGHSWGALLGQLAALQHPELVAGLVLVDPADEEFLAGLPEEGRRQEIASGEVIVEQYGSGELPDTLREIFGSFAQQLTGDRQLQALILDAYVSCYAKQSQARTVLDEKRLVFESLQAIRQARTRAALPPVPAVIFSATTGRSQDERQQWTNRHASLAASMPYGEHIVLADTGHAVNQERPAEIAQAINHVIDVARQHEA
jgi:pimeloyl-ACP methyl ester carboxylesterase